ncbi:MAG: 7-cyano-7-deazaguanine synthase [Phycisphaerales bacterium]
MNQPAQKPAVVLLSGGLDSATVLAIARHQGYAAHALSFDYGQRHRIELAAARNIAASLGVASHRYVTIDLRCFGHSALTDDIPVPKDRDLGTEGMRNEGKKGMRNEGKKGMRDLGNEGMREDASTGPASAPHSLSPSVPQSLPSSIPVTYVPARNTIFLSYALAMAEVLDAADIFIGVNAIDYSGYPDCRPDFINAFQRMARLATKAGVEGSPITIHAPLIHLTKIQIIRRGLDLGVDFSLTHSCYDPSPTGRPCGHCDSCQLRQQAFTELGMIDPVLTQSDVQPE